VDPGGLIPPVDTTTTGGSSQFEVVADFGCLTGRLIRGYEAQMGLWLARGAVIVGALFTVASLAIIVAIFTSGDASSRPLI
jgi:hypothetical protein